MIDPILQIILVMETSDEDKSDNIYISKLLDELYIQDNVVIQRIYLGGKRNYKNQKILKDIKSYTNMHKSINNGSTTVIYFVDTYCEEECFKSGSFFYNLRSFIKDKGFELVWFAKNIERTFLNRDLLISENKKIVAKNFSQNTSIPKLNIKNFSSINIHKDSSNILLILDKYLKRKQ